jgi:hypothetical protein
VRQTQFRRECLIAISISLACLTANAQEAEYGVSVPVTLSGDLAYRQGAPAENAENSVAPRFRALLSPTLRMGPHWFLYSDLEVRSSSYFTYQTGSDDEQTAQFSVMQAFVGYATKIGASNLLVKAGQLSSAFGYFPLQYDDAKTAFPEPPPAYITNLPLRPDQLPCDTNDLLWQEYGRELDYHCGGAEIDAYGMFPVTLYGLPSVEAELSMRRVDARFQITNSSPANPQSLISRNQSLQWTAGGGYTARGGLHVGVSAFRGPYLDRTILPFLPQDTTVRDFPASGLGLDAQWARGRWSIEGELQHFQFDLPGFLTSPSERAAYVQVKRILSPRMFLAVRTTAISFGPVRDVQGINASYSEAPQQVYEFAFGYRPNRHQLIKAGYEWMKRNDPSAEAYETHGSILQIQLVTTLTAFSRAFR